MDVNNSSSIAISHITLLWSSELAGHGYVDGDEAVVFSSLLSDEKRFVQLFRDQETGPHMEDERFYVVQLLISSKTLGPLKALLAEGILNWEQRSCNVF